MADNVSGIPCESDKANGKIRGAEQAHVDNSSRLSSVSDGSPAGRKGLSRAVRWFLLWSFLLSILAGLRSHTLLTAIAHDEAVFLYGGQAWAAGQTPYRDFWDHKPPNIFFFHSLPLWLFPFSRIAVLVNELLWLALAATFFAGVCRRLCLSRVATLVALIFLCLFVSERVTIRTGGLTEESSLIFVVLSYLMVFRSSRNVQRDIFWAGLFLGIAAQFRQTYGLSLLFVCVAAVWRSRQAGMDVKNAIMAVVLGVLGFAVPEAFWSSYFSFKGIWREYFEASYLFNLFYIGAGGESPMTFGESLHEHWRVLRDTGPMLAAPVLALVLAPWSPRPGRCVLGLLTLAFVCEFLPVSISGEYYHHYYVQAAVSSCLLLGFAAEAIREVVGAQHAAPSKNQDVTTSGGAARLKAGCAPPTDTEWHKPSGAKLAAGWVIALAVIIVTAWLTVGGVRIYFEQYRSVIRRNQAPGGDLAVEKSLGKALAQLTTPDERILLLGVQPNDCYFAAKRYAGARYFHNAPLFKGKFQKHISLEIQQRMLDDLKTRRPTLILLGLLEGGERERLGMELVSRRAAFLRPYLDENYAPFEQVVSAIPSEWFWYNRDCSFLVRKDQVETIRKRFETIPEEGKRQNIIPNPRKDTKGHETKAFSSLRGLSG